MNKTFQLKLDVCERNTAEGSGRDSLVEACRICTKG